LPLLALMGLVILAGGVFYFKDVTFLQLKNMDRPKTVQAQIHPSETFSIFYVHSIYGCLSLKNSRPSRVRFVLKGVRTKSPAVMEYYGLMM